jgi:hypothetical protein
MASGFCIYAVGWPFRTESSALLETRHIWQQQKHTAQHVVLLLLPGCELQLLAADACCVVTFLTCHGHLACSGAGRRP